MSHSTSLVYLTYFYPGFDLFIIQNVTSDQLPEARCFILTLLAGGVFISYRTFFGLDDDVTVTRVFYDDLLLFVFLRGVTLGNLINLYYRFFSSFISRIYLLTVLFELCHFLRALSPVGDSLRKSSEAQMFTRSEVVCLYGDPSLMDTSEIIQKLLEGHVILVKAREVYVVYG
jgi:hypothetical protein